MMASEEVGITVEEGDDSLHDEGPDIPEAERVLDLPLTVEEQIEDEPGEAEAQSKDTSSDSDENDREQEGTREERLQKAYKAVVDGMSSYKAAKQFNISRTTLSRRIKQGSSNPLKQGRKPWISTSDEKDLEDWCLGMMKIGCPTNRKTLPAVVKAILDKKREIVFPPNNLPSARWVDRFLQRHPHLSHRVPEHLGHLRAGIRYSHIQYFFTELEDYLKKEYGLEASAFLTKENSHRIFNCDETGFFLNASDKSSKVIVEKGTKKAYKRGGEGKQMMTVLFCMSAAGENIRPLIINKGKQLSAYEKIGGELDKEYCVASSERGWMVGEVFYLWLVNIFHMDLEKRNVERPVILFLDGHSSHLTLETITFAKDHGIIMYSFLPHASHILQPLDVAVFKSLKAKYREVLNECKGTLAKHDLAKRHFPVVLMRAVKSANMKANAISGFEATGLCPFNPRRIKRDKILGDDSGDDAGGNEQDVVATDVSTPIRATASWKNTCVDIFKAGYRAALEDVQERYEAALPIGIVKYYKSITVDQSYALSGFIFLWLERINSQTYTTT